MFRRYIVGQNACVFYVSVTRSSKRRFFTNSFLTNSSRSGPSEKAPVGLQVNLPPLGTWGMNPEIFAKQVLHYVDYLPHERNDNRPLCVMLRLFPDANFVQQEQHNTSKGTEASSLSSPVPLRPPPPVSAFFCPQRRALVWGGVDPEEAFRRAISSLAVLMGILVSRRIFTLLCLPTRLVVSQNFLDRLSGLLATHSPYVDVAIELPTNQMLFQQEQLQEGGSEMDEISWLRLSSLSVPWEALTVGWRYSQAFTSRHTTLPLHMLFPWARHHRLLVVGGASEQEGLKIVIDTVPPPVQHKSLTLEDKAVQEEQRVLEDQRRQEKLETMRQRHDNVEESLGLRSTPAHGAPGSSPSPVPLELDSGFTLDIPNEEMKALIMQSIKTSSHESQSAVDGAESSIPIMDIKDLDLFLRASDRKSENIPAKRTENQETSNIRRVKDVADGNKTFSCSNSLVSRSSSSYGSWYWNGLSQLFSCVRCTGFVSMPTFHLGQVEHWACEANEWMTGRSRDQTIPVVQVTPPALSVTELENQRLLREGPAPSFGSHGSNHVYNWLPEDLQDALNEELLELPPTFRKREHDLFFDGFRRLRFPNQREGMDVAIQVDKGTLRIVVPDLSQDKDKPLWLHPPGLLTKYEDKRMSMCPKGKGRSVKEIQQTFRDSCTLAAIKGITQRREQRQTQYSSEESGELREAVYLSPAVMMCIQAPGLREDALTRTWECLTK